MSYKGRSKHDALKAMQDTIALQTQTIYKKQDSTRPVNSTQLLDASITRELLIGGGSNSGGGPTDITGTIRQSVTDLGDVSGAVTIDCAIDNIFQMNLIADITITFSNPPPEYQLLHILITQNSTGGHSITWPNSLLENPDIKTAPNSETLVAIVTLDGGTTWHFSTNVASLTGIRTASQLENFTIDLDKLKTVSADVGKTIISGGSTNSTVWGDIDDITGTLSVSKIPSLPASKITSGEFSTDRIPNVPLSKIPSLPASKITTGEFNLDRIPTIPTSKISGLSSLSSLTALSEYTAAIGDTPAHLRFPTGTELLDLGNIEFNTTQTSSIGAFDTETTIKVPSLNNPENYITVKNQSMNFFIQGQKTMALSKLVNNADITDIIDSLEVFGTDQPLLKLVDTKYYGNTNNLLAETIGSIYFDAYATVLDGSTLPTPVQTTFAEIKCNVNKGGLTFETYDSSKIYFYFDHVTFNSNNFRYLNTTPSSGNSPPSSGGNNFWQEVNQTVLDRGELQFILRDINRNDFTSDGEDDFIDILTLNIDRGVHIGSHLTTDPDSNVILSGHIGLGNPGKLLISNTDLRMQSNKITELGTPTSDTDAASKKYVDDKTGSGGISNNTDILFLPANDDDNDARIGSSSKRWQRGYFVQGHINEIFADSITQLSSSNGLTVGTSSSKLGFFGVTPISKPTIDFGTNNTTTEINANFIKLRNFLEDLGLADVV